MDEVCRKCCVGPMPKRGVGVHREPNKLKGRARVGTRRSCDQLHHCRADDHALDKVSQGVRAQRAAQQIRYLLAPHTAFSHPAAGLKTQEKPTQRTNSGMGCWRAIARSATTGTSTSLTLRATMRWACHRARTKPANALARPQAANNNACMLAGLVARQGSTVPQYRVTGRFAYANTDSDCKRAGKRRRSSPSSGRALSWWVPSRTAEEGRRADRNPVAPARSGRPSWKPTNDTNSKARS